MQRPWALLAAALFVAAAIPAPAQAQGAVLTAEERAWLAENGPIRYVTNAGFAPFSFDDNGTVRGINEDILSIMEIRLGIGIERIRAPSFAETLRMISSGEADITGSLASTPEREEVMDFTDPYVRAAVGFWTKGARDLPADYEDVRIAAVRNTSTYARVADRYPGAQIVPVAEVVDGLRAVHDGSADAFVGSIPATAYSIHKLGLLELTPHGAALDVTEYHWAVRQGEPVLLGIMAKGLAAVGREDIRAIFLKWTGTDLSVPQEEPFVFPLWARVASVSAVGSVVLLGGWAVLLRRQVAARTRSLQRQTDQLTETEARFRALVDSANDGILVADRTGTITVANGAAHRIFGYEDGALIGQPLRVLMADDLASRHTDALDDFLRGGTTRAIGRTLGREGRRRDGTVVPLEVSVSTWGSGAQTSFGAIVRDITERERTRRALERSEAMLAEAEAVARSGSWEWDVPTGKVSWSRGMYDIYALREEDGPPTPDVFLDSVHPEDRVRAARELDDALRSSAPLRTEFRLVPRPGAAEWVLMQGATRAGPDGRIARIVGTTKDITREKEVERRLREAKELAEAATDAKSTFLANTSHEIRTPLNAILGMAALVDQGPLTPEQREQLAILRASGGHLLRILGDILDLSRVEAGRLSLEQAPFSPRAALAEAVDFLRPAAQAKGLALEARLDESLPATALGDAGRLRQVVLNLLHNAVKFTARGSVLLDARASEEAGRHVLELRVSDTGPGIAPDQLARIFEPFVQVDASRTRPHGGAGLGLVISRRLAELMGGSVSAQSTPGAGSTFTAIVRLDPAGPTSEAATPPTAVEPLPRMRILVAEDNTVNQKVIVAMLRHLGQEPTVVENGEQAVSAALATRFDVVLMDIQMPTLDGIEATRRILARSPPQDRPRIVAVTAHAFADERQRALDAGMDDYLTKPVELSRLAAALGQVAAARA